MSAALKPTVSGERSYVRIALLVHVPPTIDCARAKARCRSFAVAKGVANG